ncbi:MAG: DNA-processing protein DprA [Proteobacteria bacterium]|nr:DNA-processing protein DprA [Pseudomonadota bacterium]
MQDDLDLLSLHLVSNLGPIRIRRLLSRFGSAAEVLKAPLSDLVRLQGISRELAQAIHTAAQNGEAQRERAQLEAMKGWLLTHDNPLYPIALKQISNAPILLEGIGQLKESDRHAIGIVGSRHTTFYGLECARQFSYKLATAGLTIVSGLARGIDTAAHQGALAAKGRTIAVIGSGLGQMYPPENKALAERIVDQGAILSEFPFGSPPNPQTFPYRPKSGALITANLAMESGRQVYVVPGPINVEGSAGSNRLIQQGAKLVTCTEDILEEMQQLFHSPTQTDNSNLSDDERLLLHALATEQTIDDLVEQTGLAAAKVCSGVLSLELKQRVKPLPGQRYTRI